MELDEVEDALDGDVRARPSRLWIGQRNLEANVGLVDALHALRKVRKPRERLEERHRRGATLLLASALAPDDLDVAGVGEFLLPRALKDVGSGDGAVLDLSRAQAV